MFASHPTGWTARLARAAALVKAFALLEDPPRSAAHAAHVPVTGDHALRPAAEPSYHGSHAHAARTHPHRRGLGPAAHSRRPGAVPARPLPCIVPIIGEHRAALAARASPSSSLHC